MRGFRVLTVCTILFALGAGCTTGQAPSPVLQAMDAEMQRSMQKLKTQPVPPYFLSYEIIDTHALYVTGAFGKLTGSNESRRRQLDIDLRVGDYAMDNTREIRGGLSLGSLANFSSATVPIDNDPDAIRAVLWYHTDERYKHALEQLTRVKTNVEVKVAQEDQSSDFSREVAQQYIGPVTDI